MAGTDMATSLIEGLTRKFDSQEECDVFFSVEGKRIGAHKVVLSIRSEVLHEMASGWTPDKEPITIDAMDHMSFRVLLRYMYNGEISISKENVFTYLSNAIHFKMSSLEILCVDHALKSMGKENFSFYMNEAINFNSTVLQQKCLHYFSLNTRVVFQKRSLFCLSQPALSALLEVDKIDLLEISLFLFIKKWMKEKCKKENLAVNGTNMRHVIGDALFKIRFPTMTAQDFGNSVTTIKGLLTNDEIAQVFQKITVLDSKDIECSFPSNFRCQTTSHRQSYKDISHLCHQQVLYEPTRDQHCNFDFLLQTIKMFGKGENVGLSVPSLRLVLQCYADLTNSTSPITPANIHNQVTRNELHDDFIAWLDIAKTRNVTQTMTKYMDLRTKLNRLCRW